MSQIKHFEELFAWQKARELSKAVYQITSTNTFARDFALRDPIRRAAISILSSIAEGFERGGDKEFKQFLSVAKGSAGEVLAQLYVALDAGRIDQKQFDDLSSLAKDIAKLLGGFMRYLTESSYSGSKFKFRDTNFFNDSGLETRDAGQ